MFWKKCVKPAMVLKVMGVTGVLVLSLTACGSDSDTSDSDTSDSGVVDESVDDSSVVEDIVDTVLGDEAYSFTLEGCTVINSQDGLFIVEDTINSLKGVVDNQGNEILSCMYDSIAFPYNEEWEFFIVQYGNYYGVMDYSGEVIYPYEYSMYTQNAWNDGEDCVLFLNSEDGQVVLSTELDGWKELTGIYTAVVGTSFLVSDEGVYNINEEVIYLFEIELKGYEYQVYDIEYKVTYFEDFNWILVWYNWGEIYTKTEGWGIYNVEGELVWELSDAYIGTYSSIEVGGTCVQIWAEADFEDFDKIDTSILKTTYFDLVAFEYVDEPVTYEAESEEEVELLYVESHGTTYQIFNDQGVTINDELYMEAEVSDDYNYVIVKDLEGYVSVINSEGATLAELKDLIAERGMDYDWFMNYVPYYTTDDYLYLVDEFSMFDAVNVYVYPNK